MRFSLIVLALLTNSCFNYQEDLEDDTYLLIENNKNDFDLNDCNVEFDIKNINLSAPNIISDNKDIYIHTLNGNAINLRDFANNNRYTDEYYRRMYFVPSQSAETLISIELILGLSNNRRRKNIDAFKDKAFSGYEDLSRCNQSKFVAIEWPWKNHIDFYECYDQGDLNNFKLHQIEGGYFYCSLAREEAYFYLKLPSIPNRQNFPDIDLYNFIYSQSSENGILETGYKTCIAENIKIKPTFIEARTYCIETVFSRFKMYLYIPALDKIFKANRTYYPSYRPDTTGGGMPDYSSRVHGAFMIK